MNSSADFLEGTTASGKTTIGAGVKFMLKVSASKKKLHIIAGRTTGVVEKNIIQQDNGILDIHKSAKYYGNGDKDYKFPHIKFEGKIILVLGYDKSDNWKNALGGQYGCVLIDEVNTADIEFVREISTRNDYMMFTLNPDTPDLDVYKEFINRARPREKYAADVPQEIMQDLKEPVNDRWAYWFFTFYDNLGLTEEDIEKKKNSAPIGTKMYKNKILGLRGKATGLIFNLQPHHIITAEQAKKNHKYMYFSIGVDTSYSKMSHDKITLEAIGITSERKCVLLMEETYNNKDAAQPFAPSDVIPMINAFAEKLKSEYGFARAIYIDSADAGTISEAQKYKLNTGCIYDFTGAWKKTKIITRIQLQQSWMQTGDFLIVDSCTDYIGELNKYSWDEKNQPEDMHDHSINGCQYAWLPFKKMIGDSKAIAEVIKDAYND